MDATKKHVISDEKLLELVTKSTGYYSSIDKVALKYGVSIEKVCDILIDAKLYHLWPKYIMPRLVERGVSHFDLIAVYGFSILVVSRTFYNRPVDYYIGKEVNYLKVASYEKSKGSIYFICDCLACGSTGNKIGKGAVIDGITKSCGCLPTGVRPKGAKAVRNETLKPELDALRAELIKKGVLYNLESKIVKKLKEGALSVNAIADAVGCQVDYAYDIVRKYGFGGVLSAHTIQTNYDTNKEKSRKVMKVADGDKMKVCKKLGISFATYKKYKKIIENEECNS